MLDGFKRSDVKTKGARIVTVVGGSGPPLLLMHGNPFNHLSWHKVAPPLAREFTVVCTDLRGYGDSEKPPGGKDHSGYSFRAMAQDQVEVMAKLGFERTACVSTTRKKLRVRQYSTSSRSITCSITSPGNGALFPGTGSSISSPTTCRSA